MSGEPTPQGLLFVLSGPAGAGKTELMQLLRATEPGVHFCVTATTRQPRPSERHGVDYYFYSEEEFQRLAAEGAFLEHARIPPGVGYLYGTPKAPILERLPRGEDVFAQVDVQGARSIRAQVPGAVLIFLKPPDPETLRRRLVGRGTESAADLERRLENARTELGCEPEFDYSVVNADGQLEAAVTHVRSILRTAGQRAAEARRSGPGVGE